MTDRDPRTDPMRGDVVKQDSIIRMVMHADEESVAFCVCSRWVTQGGKDWLSLEIWRRWAADADVIHKGEDL